MTSGPVEYPPLHRLDAEVCEACLNGEGQECHTPGCVFWMCDPPDEQQGECLRHRTVDAIRREEAADETAAQHAEAQAEPGYDYIDEDF